MRKLKRFTFHIARCTHVQYLKIHSHLQFIRRELLSPGNQEKWVYHPLLNFSVHEKFDQIAIVNVPADYSTSNYLANSSHLINHKCE